MKAVFFKQVILILKNYILKNFDGKPQLEMYFMCLYRVQEAIVSAILCRDETMAKAIMTRRSNETF